jgi:hypothetical protein
MSEIHNGIVTGRVRIGWKTKALVRRLELIPWGLLRERMRYLGHRPYVVPLEALLGRVHHIGLVLVELGEQPGGQRQVLLRDRRPRLSAGERLRV